MSHKLLDRSPDLQALINDGYEVEIRGALALVHHVPYVNTEKQVKYGTLVSNLNIQNNMTVKPDTHVIYFVGEFPCDKEGQHLNPIKLESRKQRVGENIEVDHSFSNKPAAGYKDYYEKFVQYIRIISAPARSLDEAATAQTYIQAKESDQSVFQYQDTNSSRAMIGGITDKVRLQEIGIIGLGGSGSYILDFVAKCPVKSIHLYDGDAFLQHNAFRAPGAPAFDELKCGKKKVDYFQEIYSRMHKGIFAHGVYVSEDNVSALESLSFVFLCVDQGDAKKVVTNYLMKKNIPFVDVGLYVENVNDQLIGQVRSTLITEENQKGISYINMDNLDDKDDAYKSNIQIAELNALNACFAILDWKKSCGFYQNVREHTTSVYSINDGELVHETDNQVQYEVC